MCQRDLRLLKLFGLGVALFTLSLLTGPTGVAQAQNEDFETGDFSRFPWETGGDASWVITPVSHGGVFAVQAGKLGDNQRSWLQISFHLASEGELSFWYKVSSEADHDFLLFFVDGQAQGRWSGEIDWTEAKFALTRGNHTVKWEYIKDGSDTAGKDSAYLDDIAFPAGAVFVPLSPPPPGMVLIPAGSFQMGDSFNEGASDERPVHTVTVSAFYMDKYEVAKALWDHVANWAVGHGYDITPVDGPSKAVDHPVYDVTWYEAVKWANARSEKEGLTPCYYTNGTRATVYRTGIVDVPIEGVEWSADCYRLPTEAEWEKAARGGLSGQRYPWGNDIDCTKANYDSCVNTTTPVGNYPANGYGLYDMAGNVGEWVWDWYDSGYYSRSPGSDPRGPASGSYRVLRGGSWYIYASYCRVAFRYDVTPAYSFDFIGFRTVLPAGQ